MTIEWLAGLQPALLGVVLLWSSWLKLLARSAPEAAQKSALRRLVGAERVVGVYRLVGGVELASALALLVPQTRFAGAVAAVALTVGMLGYLGYARIAAPESSCGCLGKAHGPVRWRSFARAGVLLAAGGLALFAAGGWPAAVGELPVAAAGVLAAELAVLVVLSAELDRYWLMPLRRLRLKISHPLAGTDGEGVPLHASVQQLHKSDAYRSVWMTLSSDLLDTWDENEWRILTYAARTESGPATAVFAVPRLRYEPDLVRVAMVPDEEPALV